MILKCSICGGNAPGKQWWNQDHGHGICARCFQNLCEHPACGRDEAMRGYGKPGIHHSIPEPKTPMKYKAILPLTRDMSPISYVVSDSFNESHQQQALWHYNSSRDHDHLPPLDKLPPGTKFIPIHETP